MSPSAENGDTLIYPAGRHHRAAHRTACPRVSIFSTPSSGKIISIPSILNPATILKNSGRSRDADLDDIAADVKAADTGEYALFGNLWRHGPGRHRAGSGGASQGPARHSRRGGVVRLNRAAAAITFTRSSSARSRSRSANLERIHATHRRLALTWSSSAAPTSARRARPSARCRPSASSGCPTTNRCATGFTAHARGRSSSIRAARRSASIESLIEAGIDIVNPGAMLGRGHGAGGAEGQIRRARRCSGAEAWIRNRCCPSARRPRCASRCCGAARSSRPAADLSSTPFTTSRRERRWRTRRHAGRRMRVQRQALKE